MQREFRRGDLKNTTGIFEMTTRMSAGTWLIIALAVFVATTEAATSHTVGGSGTGWTIPTTTSFYSQWASSQKFAVGDTLMFNFTTGQHDVVEVPKASYDACSTNNQIGSTFTTGPANVTITTPGTQYYICGVTGHCSIGQKLAISVPAAAAPAPAPKAVSPVKPKKTVVNHVVGGSTGWTIPTNTSFYSQWASSQKFAVGDTLLFNFTTGQHNVVEVPKASYDSCSTKNQIGSTMATGPATVTITTPGSHYYICGVTGHCSIGQKLAISVPASSSSAPASAPAAGGPAAPVAPSSSGGMAPAATPSGSTPATPAAPIAPSSSSSGPSSSKPGIGQVPTVSPGPSGGRSSPSSAPTLSLSSMAFAGLLSATAAFLL